MRAATSIQIFPAPSPLNLVRLAHLSLALALRCAPSPSRVRFATPLTLDHFAKDPKSVLDALDSALAGSSFPGKHPDRIASRNPLKLVAGPDAVLICDGLGNRQLQLTCNLGHI